jgi:acetylornithine aminotransferase
VSAAVAKAAQEAGYLVNPVAADTIRLAPPLILSSEQAEGFLSALPAALDSTTKGDL